uniref:Centromere protein O n=1 Tax=Gopherus evgoodei TaxID=1825980 RepID=A0A8C4W0J8_9SAUR
PGHRGAKKAAVLAQLDLSVCSFPGGVLSHLEKLEAHARKLALKQDETQRQQENLVRLRARIQELRLQRDELQTKVNLQQVRVRIRCLSRTRDRRSQTGHALLNGKWKNVKAMLQAFHLTVGIEPTKESGFCISTAMKRPDSYNHSVPISSPWRQIAKKYLQTNIKCFLAMLSDHLNAYAGRKYQADQLQDHYSAFLEGTLQRNSLHNVLFFNYDVETESKTFPFRAKLVYGDLTRSLPTEATITCKGDVSDTLVEKTAAHSNLFRHTALHKAFDSFKRAAESLDQTA